MSSQGLHHGRGSCSRGGRGGQAGVETDRGQQPGVVAIQSKAAALLLPRRGSYSERPVSEALQLWRQGPFMHPPVQLGKLAFRGLVNTVSPGQLVHIVDQHSHRHFLVDTGAAFSVFPPSSTSPPCGPALAGAACQSIPCW
jgi:hypothetical protein